MTFDLPTLATLKRYEIGYCVGSAHPNWSETREQIDVTSGSKMASQMRLKKPLEPKFLLQNCRSVNRPWDDMKLLSYFAKSSFLLKPEGISLMAIPTTYATQVDGGEEFDCVIPYASLQASGYLDATSPWPKIWPPKPTPAK